MIMGNCDRAIGLPVRGGDRTGHAVAPRLPAATRADGPQMGQDVGAAG